jgi:hypothetical protein
MNGKKLFRMNRGKYSSVDGTFIIEYFILRGGKSEWVISRRNDDGFYFSAIDHADTLEEARTKYFELVKAVE